VRDRPHNVLEFAFLFGVADSKSRVAAIFLFPVWPPEHLGRSFLLYSGPYGCRIADRPLYILPVRKPGATNLNQWTGSRIQKLEVLSKMHVIFRNVVKFTVIRKRVKNVVVVVPEIVGYFGLLLVLTQFIFISRVLFSPPFPTSELCDRQQCGVVVNRLQIVIMDTSRLYGSWSSSVRSYRILM